MSRDGPAMNLNRLVYFAAVVDAGSFTRAASRLQITKAVVSQQVAKLEEEVGTTLLVRSTRSVQVTQAGRALYAHCATILRASADAFDELAQGAVSPAGTLRVAAPFDYGTSVVVPLVTELTRLYPRLEVVLNLSDLAVNDPEGDVAIRVGWLRGKSSSPRLPRCQCFEVNKRATSHASVQQFNREFLALFGEVPFLSADRSVVSNIKVGSFGGAPE
jgi:DNA-binding transcriptional LysR family regulator